MTAENIGNTSQQVAAELKRVREAAGLSQEQMAARLGMGYAPDGRKVSTGRAAVSSWETGRRAPSDQQLKLYIELGGDPAILAAPREPAPQERAPQGQPAGPPAGEAAEAGGRQPAPVVAPALAAEHPGRHEPRWRWLAIASVAVAVVLGAALYATVFRGGGGPASTWTETTGTPAHTWADPVQLTGAGTPLGPRQSVQVLCRVRGYVVEDGDPWWYRLASGPWDDRYYATSDAFYNNGATSGSVDTGVVVDEQVPVCPGSKP